MAIPSDASMRFSASRLVEFGVWLVLIGTLLFFLVNLGEEGQRTTATIAGVANIFFGLQSFLRHGRHRATVLGLFNAAFSIFVGFAGAYAAVGRDDRVPVQYLGLAILAGFALQLLVTTFAWSDADAAPAAKFPARRDSSWAIRWGAGAFLILSIIEFSGALPLLAGWLEGAAVASTVVLTIGILWRPNARLFSLGSVMIGAAFLIYAGVFHSGSGRLRIVALACALLLLFTLRFRHRAIKVLGVVAAPLMMFLLAQQRLSLQESLEAGASAGRNGLESMLVPIVILGRLLEEQTEGFPLAWGSSFLTFPISFFPDSWFPDGPYALGYALVEVYRPDMYGSGYSVAATIAGEAIYNFALLGILIFVPILVWVLKILDRRIVRAADHLSRGRMSVVALAFWSMFGGAIADLAWDGQHLFLLRTVTRLPFVMLLALLAWADATLTRKHLGTSRSRDVDVSTSVLVRN